MQPELRERLELPEVQESVVHLVQAEQLEYRELLELQVARVFPEQAVHRAQQEHRAQVVLLAALVFLAVSYTHLTLPTILRV